MNLRDYQNSASDSIIEAWRTHQSCLLVLYTGGGKTIIFADVIKRRQPGRSLVIAHREELIFQAKEKIQKTIGLDCEVEMANFQAATHLFHRTPVVIATIQTLTSGGEKKRMQRFDPADFSTVIVDESHHATAESYREALAHFSKNPNLKILGVTATPDRSDREALGQVFQTVAANFEILDGIENGWLCDITQQFIPVRGLDYSHVRTTAGDLNGKDLAAVMEAERNIMGICQPSMEVLYGMTPHTLDNHPVPEWGQVLASLGKQARRTIVFTASVKQAEACCNIFNRVVPGIAKWVCGETNKDERRNTLKEFAMGQVRVVCNCGVLTEGFDDPGVEVIIMARPTKSRTLYAQMIGRSTRTVPGLVDDPSLPTALHRREAIKTSAKPFCRVIDFVGNSGKHKLINCMDILGGKVTEQARNRAIATALREKKPVRVLHSMTKAELEIEQERKKRQEEARRQAEARKAALLARSQFRTQDVNPFARAAHDPKPAKVNGWRGGKRFSEKQATFLRRWCGKDPNQIPYGYGVRLIAEKCAQWDKQKTVTA